LACARTLAFPLGQNDQRIRKEAFDLQWVMDSIEHSSQLTAPEVPATVPHA